MGVGKFWIDRDGFVKQWQCLVDRFPCSTMHVRYGAQIVVVRTQIAGKRAGSRTKQVRPFSTEPGSSWDDDIRALRPITRRRPHHGTCSDWSRASSNSSACSIVTVTVWPCKQKRSGIGRRPVRLTCCLRLAVFLPRQLLRLPNGLRSGALESRSIYFSHVIAGNALQFDEQLGNILIG